MRLGEGHQVRKTKKHRRSNALRNTIIGVVVLLLLIVAGGVAYTWYMGKYHPAKPITSKLKPGLAPTIRKPTINPDTRESVALQNFTSPVVPGSNVSITIKTLPLSNCVISVIYDDKPSKDSGLGPKKADDYGALTWTWTVEESVPLGKWPLKITCEWNKKTAILLRDLVVMTQEEIDKAEAKANAAN